MDVSKLIECVRRHVYLYDLNHAAYKNASNKTLVWESIGRELSQSDAVQEGQDLEICLESVGEACKQRWKTVRDGYIKYKKQKKIAQSAGKKVNPYIWSSNLKFLDKLNIKRGHRKYSSVSETPYMPLDGSQGSPMMGNDLRTPSDPLHKPLRDGKDGVEAILNYLQNRSFKEFDAVDHLFMSYAETFKRFSLQKQVELKVELARLFSNAELGELQSGTWREIGGFNSSPAGALVPDGASSTTNEVQVKLEESDAGLTESDDD